MTRCDSIRDRFGGNSVQWRALPSCSGNAVTLNTRFPSGMSELAAIGPINAPWPTAPVDGPCHSGHTLLASSALSPMRTFTSRSQVR